MNSSKICFQSMNQSLDDILTKECDEVSEKAAENITVKIKFLLERIKNINTLNSVNDNSIEVLFKVNLSDENNVFNSALMNHAKFKKSLLSRCVRIPTQYFRTGRTIIDADDINMNSFSEVLMNQYFTPVIKKTRKLSEHKLSKLMEKCITKSDHLSSSDDEELCDGLTTYWSTSDEDFDSDQELMKIAHYEISQRTNYLVSDMLSYFHAFEQLYAEMRELHAEEKLKERNLLPYGNFSFTVDVKSMHGLYGISVIIYRN